MPRVTMRDIARKAGVARQTVSAILSDENYKVSKTTRERVLRLVKELDYQPNQFAQSLKTGKTNCIGISTFTGARSFLKQFNNPYLGSIYTGIGDILGQNGTKLIFSEINHHEDSTELARKKMVDGLIFILSLEGVVDFTRIKSELLAHLNIPYVVIHSLQGDRGCHNVGVDCVRAGLTITDHLIQHGYESIGCVKLRRDVPYIENLFCGYVQALSAANLPYDITRTYTVAGAEIQAGYRLAEQLLSEGRPLPRAFLVLEEFACFGMMKKFKEAGLRIPQDVALAVFEDEYLEFDHYFDVTAVVQPGAAKGRKAAEMLLNLIDKPNQDGDYRQEIVEAPLVVRKTCGCR